MRKYMGHITAAMIVMAASAAFAQSADTPASTPEAQPQAVPLPPPPPAVAPAAPAAPQPEAAAPAAPQNPAPPAPPVAAPSAPAAASAPTPTPAPAPSAAPEAAAPAAAPQAETPPAATPAPEATPAPVSTPAPEKPKAKKKPAKKKAAVHPSMAEWPDSPAMAKRLQAEAPAEPTSGAIPALPLNVMTNGNVSYVTGGIGDEELDELRTMGDSFSLHLLFSAVTGEYISEVGVRVLDDKQMEVLSVMNAGPYLYIQLPPGEYTIEANSEGKIKTAKVKVPAKGFARAHIAYTE